MRKDATDLAVHNRRPASEEPAAGYRIVSPLPEEVEDLSGICVAGGGISGVRDVPVERRCAERLVWRDIGPETRKGLAGGPCRHRPFACRRKGCIVYPSHSPNPPSEPLVRPSRPTHPETRHAIQRRSAPRPSPAAAGRA